MVKTYSRRQLSPYTSPIQIAEIGDARAISVDGRNWEIQYLVAAVSARDNDTEPAPRYALVATIEDAELLPRPRFGVLDTDAVAATIERLAALVAQAPLPFTAIDRYELWLLDEAERKPLALLRSCVSRDEMAQIDEEMTAWRVRPEWLAMPAAQLKIDDPEAEGGDYVPPVNHRLQQLVEERAGSYPRAQWFDRGGDDGAVFPPCLVSESWEREGDRELCQMYIRRLAPRLLMLQDLSRSDRRRLELAAREFALDVERFYPIYPEIVDEKLMTSLRVEARMRRAARPGPA